jgi:hypothetical protein
MSFQQRLGTDVDTSSARLGGHLEAKMMGVTKLGTMRLDEHISWAELLGERERPDELRYDGRSWVGADEGGDDLPVGETWTRGWPTAVIIEVHPARRQVFEGERPTLIERPLPPALAAI